LSRSAQAPRQRSRQLALQALYAGDLGECEERGDSMADVFDRVATHFDLPRGAREFAWELVKGTAAHRAEIDALIAAHATNWKLSRMAAVDRNVLRLATYELLRAEIPASVVIDEAIELARRFGDDPSPAFVNGVLDAVARELGRVDPTKEVR